MSEHNEQTAVVEWFYYRYPRYRGCLFAIPNGSWLGGKNRYAQVNKLKREGFKNGVSDLFLMVPAGEYHGMFIEMKDKGKTESSVSDDQKAHLILASEMGYRAVWAAGSVRAMNLISEYMDLLIPELRVYEQL